MPVKKTKNVAANHKNAETKKVEKKTTTADVEKKVEAFESKADEKVDNLVKKMWFIDSIVNASWMKAVLNWDLMDKANVWVRKHLEKICKVFWRITLVVWIIYTVLGVIAFFAWIVALFLKGMVWTFLLTVLSLAASILVVLIGRGLVKMKKWAPSVLLIWAMFNILMLILAIAFPSLKLWTYVFSTIFDIIFVLFILKNKDMFKN